MTTPTLEERIREILEQNLTHYDAGEYGDDHADMIEITTARFMEAARKASGAES